MDIKLKLSHFMIHGFAAAHAVAAATLAQTMIGDEAALTALTIAMIISLSKLYGQDWDTGQALTIIGCLAGAYLGTRGAVFLVKWIPGIGNLANAITTTVVTEILGWTIVVLLRENKTVEDIRNFSKTDISDYLQKGKKIRTEQEKFEKEIKEAVNRMNEEDKKKYKAIIEGLRASNIANSTREMLNKDLNNLFSRYGVGDEE